jgi:hypothetical protein
MPRVRALKNVDVTVDGAHYRAPAGMDTFLPDEVVKILGPKAVEYMDKAAPRSKKQTSRRWTPAEPEV